MSLGVVAARITRFRPAQRLNGFHLAISLALILALAATLMAPQAHASSRYAAMAVDARTGEVLFSRNGDAQRFPASLSKIMTVYIVFEELRAGRLKKNSPIVMSRYAAAKPPSKIGLPAGQSLTVDDAIRILVTKSANDVAAAVAEAISGSEPAFAMRMTRTAYSLGMTRTRFRNASGLPDSGQITTARDMATLGLRIQRDFPEYYDYFRLPSATFRGQTYRNHNRLVTSFEGTDGIKTGYIRASGFNLVSSVRRGGRHIIGVMMGGQTAAARNQQMINMIEQVLPRASSGSGRVIAALAGTPPGYDPALIANARAQLVAMTNPPVPRPNPRRTGAPAIAETDGIGQVIAAVDGSVQTVDPSAAASQLMAEGDTGETEQAVVVAANETGQGDNLKIAMVNPASANVAVPRIRLDAQGMARGESWHVQIGAFDTHKDAEAHIRKVLELGVQPLKNRPAFTIPFERGNKTFYRARLSGFTEAQANAACKALAQRKLSCFTLAPLN